MIKKKEIIFFIPNIESGGIEKNLVLLSNFFINKGFPVKIIFEKISFKIKVKLDSKINLVKTKKIFQINLKNKRISNSINCFLFTLFKVSLPKNSVLITLQDHPFGIIISIIKNIPSVIRIANHPIGSLKFFNNYFLYKLKLFIKLIFYNFASVIICNSKQSADFFSRRLIFKKKISAIYNPIENVLKKTKVKDRNKNQLLSVGRIEKQKNYLGLVKVVSLLSKKNKKIKLIIIGSGTEKNNVLNLAKKLKVKERIIFKNFINPVSYYNKSGILILNSFFEGLPNVLIEGLKFKIPIISTKCLSGPSEILGNGKYGYLVDVDNDFQMAKKVEEVLRNYDLALKKTDLAAKSLVRFELDKQCKKYEKIIYKL